MEKTKVTEREFYKMIIDMAKENERQDIVDFANKKIEQLNRKASGSRKENETSVEIANMIYDVLVKANEKMTISQLLQNEILKTYTYTDGKEIKHLTNQKISAILNKMANPKEGNAKVVRVPDKKNVYFIANQE